jgi:hypothetical protein
MRLLKFFIGLFVLDGILNGIFGFPLGFKGTIFRGVLYGLVLAILYIGKFGDRVLKDVKGNPQFELQLILFLGAILIGTGCPLIIFGYYFRMHELTGGANVERIIMLVISAIVSVYCISQLVSQVVKGLKRLPKSF